MSAESLIVYLLVAAIVGALGQMLVGRGVPGGIIGSILAAIVGIWLMINVLGFAIPGDIAIAGVPIFTAIVGAAIVSLIVSLLIGLTYRRSYRR